MEGVFAFQRRGDSASLLTTVGLSTFVTLQVAGSCVVEIANISTTAAAAFTFAPSSASAAVTATTAMRTIPPLGVLYERLILGSSFASAIAVSGTPTLVFTPGTVNG